MKHLDVIIWEHGDRVVSSRGPGEVIRPPVNPWASTPPVGVRLDEGSDWQFFAQELQPEPGAEANNALHRCCHTGPALNGPGEPARCGPCLYCGLAYEEWETPA
jgi:hypothetical protein